MLLERKKKQRPKSKLKLSRIQAWMWKTKEGFWNLSCRQSQGNLWSQGYDLGEVAARWIFRLNPKGLRNLWRGQGREALRRVAPGFLGRIIRVRLRAHLEWARPRTRQLVQWAVVLVVAGANQKVRREAGRVSMNTGMRSTSSSRTFKAHPDFLLGATR